MEVVVLIKDVNLGKLEGRDGREYMLEEVRDKIRWIIPQPVANGPRLDLDCLKRFVPR